MSNQRAASAYGMRRTGRATPVAAAADSTTNPLESEVPSVVWTCVVCSHLPKLPPETWVKHMHWHLSTNPYSDKFRPSAKCPNGRIPHAQYLDIFGYFAASVQNAGRFPVRPEEVQTVLRKLSPYAEKEKLVYRPRPVVAPIAPPSAGTRIGVVPVQPDIIYTGTSAGYSGRTPIIPSDPRSDHRATSRMVSGDPRSGRMNPVLASAPSVNSIPARPPVAGVVAHPPAQAPVDTQAVEFLDMSQVLPVPSSAVARKTGHLANQTRSAGRFHIPEYAGSRSCEVASSRFPAEPPEQPIAPVQSSSAESRDGRQLNSRAPVAGSGDSLAMVPSASPPVVVSTPKLQPTLVPSRVPPVLHSAVPSGSVVPPITKPVTAVVAPAAKPRIRLIEVNKEARASVAEKSPTPGVSQKTQPLPTQPSAVSVRQVLTSANSVAGGQNGVGTAHLDEEDEWENEDEPQRKKIRGPSRFGSRRSRKAPARTVASDDRTRIDPEHETWRIPDQPGSGWDGGLNRSLGDPTKFFEHIQDSAAVLMALAGPSPEIVSDPVSETLDLEVRLPHKGAIEVYSFLKADMTPFYTLLKPTGFSCKLCPAKLRSGWDMCRHVVRHQAIAALSGECLEVPSESVGQPVENMEEVVEEGLEEVEIDDEEIVPEANDETEDAEMEDDENIPSTSGNNRDRDSDEEEDEASEAESVSSEDKPKRKNKKKDGTPLKREVYWVSGYTVYRANILKRSRPEKIPDKTIVHNWQSSKSLQKFWKEAARLQVYYVKQILEKDGFPSYKYMPKRRQVSIVDAAIKRIRRESRTFSKHNGPMLSTEQP